MKRNRIAVLFALTLTACSSSQNAEHPADTTVSGPELWQLDTAGSEIAHQAEKALAAACPALSDAVRAKSMVAVVSGLKRAPDDARVLGLGNVVEVGIILGGRDTKLLRAGVDECRYEVGNVGVVVRKKSCQVGCDIHGVPDLPALLPFDPSVPFSIDDDQTLPSSSDVDQKLMDKILVPLKHK